MITWDCICSPLALCGTCTYHVLTRICPGCVYIACYSWMLLLQNGAGGMPGREQLIPGWGRGQVREQQQQLY